MQITAEVGAQNELVEALSAFKCFLYNDVQSF